MSNPFTPLEDKLFHELDEPFRSRALLIAYRVRERLAADSTVVMWVRDAWRDHDRQEQLWRVGRILDPVTGKWVDAKDPANPCVTWVEPGHSAHNYRRAIHLILADATTKEWLPPNAKKKRTVDKRWHIIGEECAKVDGVRWGGEFRDYAHIEDRNYRVIAKKRGWVGLGKTERAEGE